MAYYDESHHHASRDRYARPASTYSQDYYYSGDGPYNGSRHETGVVRRHDRGDESPSGDYGYEYGYGLPPQPRHSRVSAIQDSVPRSHSMGGRGSHYDDSDHHRPRHSRHSKRYDYDDSRDRHSHRRPQRSPSSSRSPPPRRRRKSMSEQAMEALGIGSAASSSSRHHERGRGRSHGHHNRSYSYSPSPTRSKSRHRRDRSEQRVAQAMKAALTAGAVEAFRVRKEPGDWTGAKGKRILTAALTAGGTDGIVDRDPTKHSKRHIIESTLAGLAATHLVNGPRSRSRSKSRGREKNKSKLQELAAAGALAAAGKEAYSRFRSRSRPRGRSHSRDSNDDSPRRSKKRSKSVSEYISRGMEALGLENKEKDKDDRRRHHDRPSRRDDYSDYDSDGEYGSRHHGSSRRTRHSRDVGRPLNPGNNHTPSPSRRSGATGEEGHAYHQDHNLNSDKDSDLGSSTDEEHQHKKMTRKMLLTTGLATVATIHAAHGLHGSMEKHKKRVKMVKEGDMSPEEARKLRVKNNFVDAANVGLATIGIKGAVDEWRHVDHMRKECKDFRKQCESKRERRRTQSYGAIPRHRTIYPDEIEEYHPSEPGSRGRSMSVAQEV
ncbi:hypothetical protein BDV26DRAFT_269835 [Aspergillus bertholletiae]|uniref:DUF3824 domain-containing protein n=1 Tax=Aspergillus bertholletiae TaxID=1226010 RepID=A0A5N7AXM5_9EURO|nr:hypothetical protein BDV26DRAFT_269835 [Aspergillus bertholletiae]